MRLACLAATFACYLSWAWDCCIPTYVKAELKAVVAKPILADKAAPAPTAAAETIHIVLQSLSKVYKKVVVEQLVDP